MSASAQSPPDLTTPEGSRRSLTFHVVLRMGVVLVLAAAVAVAVYVASDRVAPTYESSATVSVTVRGGAGTSSQSVSASNDLASQYAQLASAGPVLHEAQTASPDVGALGGKISASTVSAQNIIRITAKAGTAMTAQRRADATANALITYVAQVNANQATSYAKSVSFRLRPIDQQIKDAEARLSKGSADDRRNASLILASLVSQRQQVQSTIAQSAAASQPDLLKVTPGGAGQQTAPRPKLYALVGFVVTLLIGGRLALIGLDRYRSRPYFSA